MRNIFAPLTALAGLSLLVAAPAVAQDSPAQQPTAKSSKGDRARGDGMPRRTDFSEQNRAFQLKESGRSLALPVLQQRVQRSMPDAEFIGAEFRGDSYRLKYMQDGRVIWIDVDSKTGRVVGRSR